MIGDYFKPNRYLYKEAFSANFATPSLSSTKKISLSAVQYSTIQYNAEARAMLIKEEERWSPPLCLRRSQDRSVLDHMSSIES